MGCCAHALLLPIERSIKIPWPKRCEETIMSACMASPIKLAHALQRRAAGEEVPKTCLAAEEMGDGILVPSRLYMYMNKSDGKRP